MNYTNVFTNEESFNDASNNLSKPQLAYIPENDKIFCMTPVPEPDVEMVDLGLSVKWAKYNVGATGGSTAESWYGGYYSWAELETKTDYSWGTYKYCEGTETSLTKYNNNSGYGTVDNKMQLELEDDAAYINQYHKVRIPTKVESDELRDESKIDIAWTSDYNGSGVAGCTFTSKVDGYVGNVLFIPAAGFYNGTTHIGSGMMGGIWTKTVWESEPSYAYGNMITSSGASDTYNGRFNGMSVRGVQSK